MNPLFRGGAVALAPKTSGLIAALNTSQLNVLYPFVPIRERFLFLLVPRLTEKSIDTSCSLWDRC